MNNYLHTFLHNARAAWTLLTLEVFAIAFIYASARVGGLSDLVSVVLSCCAGVLLVVADMVITSSFNIPIFSNLPFIQSSEAIRDRKIRILDESLLRMLASWDQTHPEEDDAQTKSVLKDILIEVIRLFGNNGRAAILLPDSIDPSSYITCYEQVEMSPDSIAAMRFYIGTDAQRQRSERGVAGESFVTGDILVGHMDRSDGYRTCKDQYRYVKHPGKRPYNPYKSFVCVPIKGLTTRRTIMSTLGVLCIDSPKEDTFDAKDTTPTLDMIATRIAASILICEKFRSPQIPQFES